MPRPCASLPPSPASTPPPSPRGRRPGSRSSGGGPSAPDNGSQQRTGEAESLPLSFYCTHNHMVMYGCNNHEHNNCTCSQLVYKECTTYDGTHLAYCRMDATPVHTMYTHVCNNWTAWGGMELASVARMQQCMCI